MSYYRRPMNTYYRKETGAMRLTLVAAVASFLTVAGIMGGALTHCVHAEPGWKEYRSHHFIIYYKDAPRDFIKSIEEMAEYYYREITSNLGFMRHESWSWDKRAQIYIYRDADDYRESAQQARWSSGMAAVREKVIRTFPAAHGFFDSTLPHELGHIIFREFVGFSVDIPLWLDEGVAMYQEKARRWGANAFVARAHAEGRFIPLTELGAMRLLRDTPDETVELFYASAASAVYYLITEFGQYKFAQLCRRLRSGVPFEKALYDTYIRFKNVADLNEAWVTYLKRHQK